jgi:hypothetical protein
MWKILDAEIRYHRIAIAGALGVGALFVTYMALSNITKGEDSITAWSLMSTIMTLYIYLLIHIGAHQDQEKRDRLNAVLPISIKHLGIARWALLIFLQIGFAALTLVGVMMANKFDLKSLFSILSSNAFLFLIVALIAIYQELGHFGARAYRRLFVGLLFLFLVLIAWLILSGRIIMFLRNIFEPYMTPEGATIYTLLAIGLFFLNVIIFTRRRSYLS